MSGHSKWSSIKHQKGAADAKRGKLFTRLANAITVAVKQGGKDASANPRLTLAIDMGKKNNMPKENIERAIKRGTGELGGQAAEELTYEGYGPAGTAILVSAFTDNRNRTGSEVRAAFTKHGGKLGESGSVAYLFSLRGEITASPGILDEESAELAILDSGAEDYEQNQSSYTIFTDPKNLHTTKEALEKAGFQVENVELRYQANQTVSVEDEGKLEQIGRLVNALEELDDVSDVVANVA